VMSSGTDRRSVEAAVADARSAVAEFDDACQWFDGARGRLTDPLAAEVWVFNEDFTEVLLVKHRWRNWVPPGGKVDPGETPREAALRELFEETGVRATLLPRPAAVAVRSYHPDWSATLGLSYAAVVDASCPLLAESGQPVAWTALDRGWDSFFPDDPPRIRRHATWMMKNTVAWSAGGDPDRRPTDVACGGLGRY